ncbi:MAG: tetratricopeptide repeat protein [Chloroflexia bacterium]|nr:tetratricopeptide repeat protein [Chloroflexia bacterium]
MPTVEEEIAQLKLAMQALEDQRAVLGDAPVEAGLAALQRQLNALQTQHPTMLAEERRRLVSVLFVDIVGFTRFSEEHDPEEVAQLVGRFYEVVAQTVVAHGGEVARYLGDAVMAVFGLQQTAEDDAQRAVQAGLLLPPRLQEAGLPFQIRTGIHSGLVLSGTLEVRGQRDWTVLGDTVNVASRLQVAAPTNGLLISRTTFQQVRGHFVLEACAPLSLKGKAELVQAYLVQQTKERPYHPLTRGVEGLFVRTIGREQEIALLQEAFRQVLAERRARWITVIGDPGIGKSRLLSDLEEWLDLRPESMWYLRAQCRPAFQQQPQPYALLRAMWFERFGLAENVPPQEAKQVFEQGIRSLWPDAVEDSGPVLGHLIGLPFEGHPALRGLRDDLAALRGRSIVLAQALWQHLLEQQPLLLLLEDLHWADRPSQEWLLEVIQGSSGPCLVVGAARPEWPDPPWDRHQRLPLSALSEEQGRQLVRELLQQVESLPPELEAMISERTEGVPYYVEEIVNWLLDQGVIEAGPEHWSVHMDRMEGRPLPSTLQHLLLSRVDTLAPAERRALQWAAVVGRVFWEGAIEAIGQVSEIRPVLERLQKQRMVEYQPVSSLKGERAWAFRHMLLRDAVYDTMLRRDRPGLHLRVARWLEGQAGDWQKEYAALLAGHYEIAGEVERAAHFYLQAALQSRYAATEAAISYGLQAVELEALTERFERVQLYRTLGELLSRQARYQEALRIYQTLREEAGGSQDEELLAQAQLGISRVLEGQGRPQAALEEMAGPMAALAAPVLSPPTKAEILYWAGWLHHRLGENEAALQLALEALDLIEDVGTSMVRVHNLNLLGGIYIQSGRYDLAEARLGEALELLRELKHWRGIGIVLGNLGEVARARGKYQQAEVHYREALSIARRIGDRQGETFALNNVGASLLGSGQLDAAEDFLRQSIGLQERLDSQMLLSETYRFLAETLLKRGRLDQALEAALHALELGQRTGYTEYLAAAWRTVGRIMAYPDAPQGDWSPRHCFEESLRLFEEGDMPMEQAHTLQEYGQYLIESGQAPQRGQALLEQAEGLLGG